MQTIATTTTDRIGTTADAPVVWQEVACPLCGDPNWQPDFEARDPDPAGRGLHFQVARCPVCSLRFTNPRPAPESMGQFYSSDYRPHRRPTQMGKRLKRGYALGLLRGRASERRSLPWRGEGRLLDFGCGGGSYIARMAGQGWRVIGLDASVGAVRRIHQQLGLQALVGSLPHPDLEPASFEVVTMWHSLEHVHDPLEILRQAYLLLVPGGRLIVATPNLASWPALWFGQDWFGLDLPRHLTHFTPATLNCIIERAGFRMVSSRLLRHADWLRSSARLHQQIHPTNRWSRLALRKPLARLLASACYLAGRSDCMMAIAERPG